MKNKYYPNLASPITINGVTFKNRIFGAPMSNPELDPDCHMRKEDVAFHENRARGGLASVAIGLGIVDAVGRTHTKEVTLYDVKSLPSLKEAAKAMHRHNCNAVMELAHGGKYANARGHGEASEHYALGPNDEVNPDGLPVRAMTEEEIFRAAEAFGQAAKLVKEAGFDMVLIHGGHGWLLGQFMSPSMNHRTDQWGGSLENRMRFPLLVIEKVREAVGPHFPIEFRMSGAELIQGRLRTSTRAWRWPRCWTARWTSSTSPPASTRTRTCSSSPTPPCLWSTAATSTWPPRSKSTSRPRWPRWAA